MDYFPIFLKLKQQNCLVLGAGEIAARKIELLLRAQASVSVIAPEACDTVLNLHRKGRINYIDKRFDEQDIKEFHLIVAATNDDSINILAANLAKKHNIPINVVDNPKLCSFIFPAIIDRSPIIAAVSSGGAAPVLTRLIRARLESLIPSAYGRLAELAEKYRPMAKQKITTINQRRIFWEKVLQGPIAEQVFSGQHQDAEHQLLTSLQNYSGTDQHIGEVYLVGAGPGDPDLLTFRALRLMQQADVVVYDRLVSDQILDLVRRDAEKIYVGKQRDNHSVPQESINDLLARLALSGKRVVRLKGGDPFIFGRGGEEIETLMQQNIHFQIVPGITAASGCACYAGIPLTHRDHAQSCTFVTGHLKDNSVNLNWDQLSAPNQTIVIYMGLVGLQQICSSLIEHGSPKDLPIAVVQQGTTSNQRIITGTLDTIASIVEQQHVSAPTLIIIGTVVKLHKQLTWFSTSSP